MTPHRGLIGARKKRVQNYNILKNIRDILKVETFREILPAVKQLIEDKDLLFAKNIMQEHRNRKAELKAESLKKEFGKKIGRARFIVDKDKTTNYRKGVLYFSKQHIGKRVIIWEKR